MKTDLFRAHILYKTKRNLTVATKNLDFFELKGKTKLDLLQWRANSFTVIHNVKLDCCSRNGNGPHLKSNARRNLTAVQQKQKFVQSFGQGETQRKRKFIQSHTQDETWLATTETEMNLIEVKYKTELERCSKSFKAREKAKLDCCSGNGNSFEVSDKTKTWLLQWKRKFIRSQW